MNENFELFDTRDLADAFVNGFEAAITIADCDHSTIEEPFQTPTGEWRGNYGYMV